MDIVKKNLISIICGAVALIALGAWVWPLGSYTTDLQAKAAEQVQLHQILSRLQKSPRRWPVIDPENPVQEELNQFPCEAVINKGKEIRGKVQMESQTMLTMATQMNKHEPLVADCLPSPSDTKAYEFRDNYKRIIATDSRGGGRGARLVPLMAKLRGGVPPTADEIKRQAETLQKESEKHILMVNGQKDPISEQKVNQALLTELLALPNRMKRQAAERCMIYVDSSAPHISAAISATSGAPPADQIWQAQIGLWVQQDVTDAIVAMNQASGAKNVIEAPIKRIQKIVVNDQILPRPGETAPDPAALAAQAAAQYPTGRVSNSLYDVTRFTITLYIEAAKIPVFIQELEKNRFITVYQADIDKVDSAREAEKDGYVYGSATIAKLTLQCEALFLRSWTAPLMPAVVRQALGIAPVGGTNPN